MWLLETNVKKQIDAATLSGFSPTAAQVSEFEAAADDVMVIAGPQAQINIKGVLTATRSWFAMYFGGGNTTYADIQSALAEADADSNVNEITMYIDSPGGAVHGLFECIDAIRNTVKPIRVKASHACSAAYAIAAAAGPISASSEGSMFGSIGVVVDAYVSDQEVSVTSTNAPKKRPDISTEEGQAVIREELDSIHDLFVDVIAQGREQSADTINQNYGRGATLLASDALKNGMIDSIGSPAPLQSNSSATTAEATEIRMDLAELKLKHPEVYAQCVTVGVDQERDRANSHIIMGKATGGTELALSAIADGLEMTATMSAKYNAELIKKTTRNNRLSDDVHHDALDGADADDADQKAKFSDTVFASARQGLHLEGDS